MKKKIKPSFDEQDLTSILYIDKNLFDFDKLKDFAKEKNLSEKPDIHITIIGRETGELIKNNIERPKDFMQLIKKIKKLLNKVQWKFSSANKTYFISKTYKEHANEKRRSLIQFIEMPVINDFYKKLNKILQMNLKTPIPHLTLFANSTREETKLRGIGIYSKKQFKNLNPKLIK
jgi:hypothetical protein